MKYVHYYNGSPKRNNYIFSILISSLDVYKDITLEHDYVQLEYMKNNKLISEYFMYPLNKNKKQKNKVKKTQQEEDKTRKPGELDIIMIMIDSISRASAQRYMNKTYQMLEQDASSVILKVCIFS